MARTPKKKGDKLVVYPKQWPDTRVDKPEIDKDDSVTPHLGHEYRLMKKFSEQIVPGRPKGARETFAKRFRVTRSKHMPHPAPIRGGEYKQTPQMEKPHYEETEAMTGKTYTEFVTEAAKRGRPRKLRPGEEADTLHIQDQLNKLTHPNHVEVHFKDGSKHRIPREHANMAIHHLNSLKPIDRADHAEHMAKSHGDFYHVLSKKSIPSKKKTITLAGPKLRKEDYEKDAADLAKHNAANARYYKGLKKSTIDPSYNEKNAQKAKDLGKTVKKLKTRAVTGMDEEVQLDESHRVGVTYSDPNSSAVSQRSEKKFKNVRVNAASEDEAIAKAKKHVKNQGYRVHGAEITTMKEEADHDDDGWYAHKEMHGSKAISKEDWKKGVRPKKSMKKEEAVRVDEVLDDRYSRKSYGSKAMDQIKKNPDDENTKRKRLAGLKMVGKKSAKAMGIQMSEDAEQIDEWGQAKRAITGPHAKTGSMAINPPKIGYAGKTKKLKKQTLDVTPNMKTEERIGFKKLKASLAHKAGIKDPSALAASIGRKKYGKEKFQKMASAGKEKEKD